MSFEESHLITPTNSDEDKYWRFVGQDWYWIKISKDDDNRAKEIAKRRVAEAKRRNLKNKAPDDSKHILGAQGEVFAEKLFGKKVNQVEYRDSVRSDIGDNIEIKSIAKHGDYYGNLMVNQSDLKNNRIYVLVLCELWPSYAAAMGWQYGSYIRTCELVELKWRNEGAYRCSWHNIRPMSEILIIE